MKVMGKWILEENELFFLRNNYKTMSYQEMALFLNKEINQVKDMIESLEIKEKFVFNRFKNYEEQYIRANYNVLLPEKISEKLEIKVKKVKSIIKALKLDKNKPFFKHDYLSIDAISKILKINTFLIKDLLKIGFIKSNVFNVFSKNSTELIYIDEFEKIKYFLNNYISVKDFADSISYIESTVLYRIKVKKIKDLLKVGSKYFINKKEIEIQRSL